ncbi:transcriptional activator GLI3 [Platysternon megacephalum]|uniref:Transcriptional activator GLI3 n=1 Tax=Platysternon megacephalum TaxID=55544 RepID=A0A4D9EAP5_9SAUR|nr:transcriptional activator GLI3 [Platysternon megacephalum]
MNTTTRGDYGPCPKGNKKKKKDERQEGSSSGNGEHGDQPRKDYKLFCLLFLSWRGEPQRGEGPHEGWQEELRHQKGEEVRGGSVGNTSECTEAQPCYAPGSIISSTTLIFCPVTHPLAF